MPMVNARGPLGTDFGAKQFGKKTATRFWFSSARDGKGKLSGLGTIHGYH
jgi:hypothetical protein